MDACPGCGSGLAADVGGGATVQDYCVLAQIAKHGTELTDTAAGQARGQASRFPHYRVLTRVSTVWART